MSILIIAVITFIITAAWQTLATRKIRAIHLFMVKSMQKEMDEMAQKLGFENYIAYLKGTRGKEYADIAAKNIRSLNDSFTDRGA